MDTTGAGDAFVAGLLSQVATDVSLIQVLTCSLYIYIYVCIVL